MEAGYWTPWTIAICAIGALLGIFFALNGFGAPQKADDLKNNPRVKNLIWLVTAAAAVILADWKKLASNVPESGTLFTAYLMGAIGGAALCLLLVVAFLYIEIAARNRRSGSAQPLPFGLIADYLHYGYAYYGQRRDALLQEANSNASLNSERDRLASLKREAASRGIIAVLIQGIAAVLSEANAERRAERRAEMIDQILGGAADAIKQVVGEPNNLNISTNYMTFVPRSSATPEQCAAALFRFGDETRYTGYLILQKSGMVQDTIALPVDRIVVHGKMVLPGAPEAFATGQAAIINCSEVAFRDGVARATKTEIQTFFASAPYKSVASIPIVGKNGPVGVINIESSRADLLGEGPEFGMAACGTLQPFAALLSRIL